MRQPNVPTTTITPAAAGAAHRRVVIASSLPSSRETYAKAKCHQKALLTGAAVDPACLDKAETKFTTAIGKADGQGLCTDTASALEGLVDGCIESLVAAPPTTTTSTLPTTTTTAPSTTTTTSDSTTTTSSTTSTTTTMLLSGCFQDLGDGTIRDTCMGLQWEKKTDTAGGNNVDNRYSWHGCCGNGSSQTLCVACQPNAAAAATCAANASNGTFGCSVCASGTCNVDPEASTNSGFSGASTTVWDWLNQVNAENFAGHSDWRLPSEQGRVTGTPTPRELEAILAAPYYCPGPGPATIVMIHPIFGPTCTPYNILNGYWSATMNTNNPGSYAYHVRAVRSGP
jgi:hypothetical protein